MFSVDQKRKISEAVQKVLRDTNHPELPEGDISFSLHVDGKESWSWDDIQNNGAVLNPSVNLYNEIVSVDQKLKEKQGDPIEPPVDVYIGQQITTNEHAEVIFQGLDHHMGQITARLQGVTYPGTYYPFPEKIESQGFVLHDRTK